MALYRPRRYVGLVSLDAHRGLLYVPTSTPTSDYWGGCRVGANLFAESVVCLDARTGDREWHFRAVHHVVWDYDSAAAPSLVTITVGRREIDAAAQVSNHGFTLVFDRGAGEPVWPIKERAVDTETDMHGEALYPTQPFPTRPPPSSRRGFRSRMRTTRRHRFILWRWRRQSGSGWVPCSRRQAFRGRSSGRRRAVARTGAERRSPSGTGLLDVRTSKDPDRHQVCVNADKDPEIDRRAISA